MVRRRHFALRKRVGRREAQMSSPSRSPEPARRRRTTNEPRDESHVPNPLGRRGFLRAGVVAGAAGVGVVAASALPAHADDGDPVIIGEPHTGQTTTALTIEAGHRPRPADARAGERRRRPAPTAGSPPPGVVGADRLQQPRRDRQHRPRAGHRRGDRAGAGGHLPRHRRGPRGRSDDVPRRTSAGAGHPQRQLPAAPVDPAGQPRLLGPRPGGLLRRRGPRHSAG